MIVVVNYGMGNLGSIVNMLKRLGVKAHVSSKPADIAEATKLILPGVGAFDTGMKQIMDRGLAEPLGRKVLGEKTPLLGICLGMHLITRRSEEGRLEGLNWLDAEVVRFDTTSAPGVKVPHMGWNRVAPSPRSRLFHPLPPEPRFYFVHSFHVVSGQPDDIAASAFHGYRFVAAVERDNIAGVQFHPEKSHKFGMQLLQNFVERFG